MFLVIPIILSLLSPVRPDSPSTSLTESHPSQNGSSAPTPFQPLSDLVAAASSSSMFSIPSPFSSNSSTDGGWNEDISRLLALKPVRRVFKLCCERKGSPFSPLYQSERSCSQSYLVLLPPLRPMLGVASPRKRRRDRSTTDRIST